MTDQAQLLPGTLDLLILRAVSLGPLHGYGILLRIGQISGNALLIEQGALYPGLFRLVRQGLLKAELGHVGEQSPRQVLRTDRRGPQASARGDRQLESPGDRHRRRRSPRNRRKYETPRLASLPHRHVLPAFADRTTRWTRSFARTSSIAPTIWSAPASTRAEAERRARIEFGGHERFKEECHEAAGRQFRRDTRCRTCASAFACCASLPASRIAAVVDAGVGHRRKRRGVRRIECADPAPAECAAGGEPLRNRPAATSRSSQSYPDYLDLRDRNRSFEGLAAYQHRAGRAGHGRQSIARLGSMK